MGNQYSYEDHPDGTHCLYKTACVARYTSLAAFSLALWDVICLTKPSNIGGFLAVYPRYMAPGLMTGVVFGLTTCTLTQVRKKDDTWNYFFGGGAAGSMFGAFRRSFKVGVPCAVFFALAAVSYKTGRRNDFTFFPLMRSNYGSYDSMKYDFSLPRNTERYK